MKNTSLIFSVFLGLFPIFGFSRDAPLPIPTKFETLKSLEAWKNAAASPENSSSVSVKKFSRVGLDYYCLTRSFASGIASSELGVFVQEESGALRSVLYFPPLFSERRFKNELMLGRYLIVEWYSESARKFLEVTRIDLAAFEGN